MPEGCNGDAAVHRDTVTFGRISIQAERGIITSTVIGPADNL